MAHKITIVDKETNTDVTLNERWFIGTDNKVYKIDRCEYIELDESVYWKFDMIEVKK